MSNQAYAPLTHAQQVFKDLIWTPMVKSGELYLEEKVPLFALPVIKQLDEAALEVIANWTFSQLVLIMDTTTIRLVNPVHQKEYDAQSLSLKVIAIDKGVDSDDYKKARDLALRALSRFTRFGQ